MKGAVREDACGVESRVDVRHLVGGSVTGDGNRILWDEIGEEVVDIA